MTIDEQKITTYHSICAVVLRELRVQRSMHQAQVADHFSKPPTVWQDVESGKKKIDLETLLRVCRGMFVAPGLIMQIADAYEQFIRSYGWSVVVTDLAGADALIKLANDYWKSPGCRAKQEFGTPILNVPFQQQNNGWLHISEVFGFVVDEQYRAMQLDEERHRPFVGPMRPVASLFGNI
ncbi:helix-turn-helix transcriptional regulator [Paraburkholderia heleia]|uniref:helix-turn-helix domain-containing protein n=1 Tax=Paraburkholderia heleia TaxID=634127 RepID=UPI0031E2F3D7